MIEKVSNIAEAVAAGVSRRRFLARVSGWAAGLAGLLGRVPASAQEEKKDTWCIYLVETVSPGCTLAEGDVVCFKCTAARIRIGTCPPSVIAQSGQCIITLTLNDPNNNTCDKCPPKATPKNEPESKKVDTKMIECGAGAGQYTSTFCG